MKVAFLQRGAPFRPGATPGPACYGRGGGPTVTDAVLVLGYFDPENFLDGRMELDREASVKVIGEIGEKLGLGVDECANAILTVANEHMVGAITELTVNEGIDPRESVIVAGGGAGGAVIDRIASEMGCDRVLIPRVAGALSAMGGQFTDVIAEFSATHQTSTADFDFEGTNQVLAKLDAETDEFTKSLNERGVEKVRTEYFANLRYAFQVWDLELSLPVSSFESEADLEQLKSAFDELHQRIYAVSEPGQDVEVLTWGKRAFGSMGSSEDLLGSAGNVAGPGRKQEQATRKAYFGGHGWQDARLVDGGSLEPGDQFEGPAIIAEPSSTIVIHPTSRVVVTKTNNYLIEVGR